MCTYVYPLIIPLLLVGCLSTANGSALVKMGNTTVMCGIKAVSTGIHFPQILFSTQTSHIGRIKFLTLGLCYKLIINSYIVKCIYSQNIPVREARLLLSELRFSCSFSMNCKLSHIILTNTFILTFEKMYKVAISYQFEPVIVNTEGLSKRQTEFKVNLYTI